MVLLVAGEHSIESCKVGKMLTPTWSRNRGGCPRSHHWAGEGGKLTQEASILGSGLLGNHRPKVVCVQRLSVAANSLAGVWVSVWDSFS